MLKILGKEWILNCVFLLLQVNETTHLGDSQKVDELYDIPVGATTTDLPPGVLYRVHF